MENLENKENQRSKGNLENSKDGNLENIKRFKCHTLLNPS